MSITRRKFVEAASLGAAFGSILPTTPFAGSRAQGVEDAEHAGQKAKIIDLDDRVRARIRAAGVPGSTEMKSYPVSTVLTVNFFQRVAIEGMCLGEGTVAG
jgi:hypothetical protein